MPRLLLVGSLAPAATATLEDRGVTLTTAEETPLVPTSGVDPAPETPSQAAEDGGSAVASAGSGTHSSAGEETPDVDTLDCALVVDGEGADAAIAVLAEVAPDLPVLYAVDVDDAPAAGAALEAGADDRVLLTGDHDGARIARRIEGLVGPFTDEDMADVTGQEARSGAEPSLSDDRIGTLLEGARNFTAANDRESVAHTAVETAERALGYEIVVVYLVSLDGERLEPAARTERTTELGGDVRDRPLSESLAAPAITENRTLELGAAELSEAGYEAASALVFPLGRHGVLVFGSTEQDAFGAADRRIGELLAANASSALQRIDRVGRIQALQEATRAMLDVQTPTAVARRAVDAAQSILDRPVAAVYTRSDDTDALAPMAVADRRAGPDREPPTIHAGSGTAWAAYEQGELRRSADDGPFGCERTLFVPLDEHGLLVVGGDGDVPFGESDRQLARLLATNTGRTLDRVERTQDLERYESVFETVNDMVYVLDDEGRIQYATPVLAERLGYERGELVGEPVAVLVDEDDLAEGRDLVQELLGAEPGASRCQRLEITDAEGELLPVEVEMSLLPGGGHTGVVGTVRDISDLLEVRERLDSQQDRFEYLFENIPDPVVEGYFDGHRPTVTAVNEAFEETFGYSEEELVGGSLNDMIVPEGRRDEAAELDERTAHGQIEQREVERETQYGIREFLFRGVPYTDAMGRQRGFAIYTDITDQRERERHLEVLQRVLRHNVRNEVNVLLAGLDQLGDRVDATSEGAELLGTLENTAEDLMSMSKKAKRISRMIEDERHEATEVDLARIARSVADQCRSTAGDAEITVDAPESCPVVGSVAIERAVEELIGNSVTHAGEAPRIEVTVTTSGTDVHLTVSDDGPGIPATERRVLEAGEITPLQHGSGLGLWLVKHATGASGGTVAFDESTDGASVTLSFRRAEREP